jgi:translation initiation factor 1A
MPKNKGKGGKNRRRGKNENESEKRELLFKEDEQEYAQVTKMLGNGRLEAMCFDGVKRLCHIRGKLRKKVSYNCWNESESSWVKLASENFAPY